MKEIKKIININSNRSTSLNNTSTTSGHMRTSQWLSTRWNLNFALRPWMYFKRWISRWEGRRSKSRPMT